MKQVLSIIFLTLLAHHVEAQHPSNMNINQQAPVIQKREIIIEATPEEVWDILTNINAWQQWNDRIKKSSMQEELVVGSPFTWTINGSKIKSRVHSLSPYKMFGWEGKAFGASAIHNWYLEVCDHGTKVTVEESMEGWVINLIKKKMNEKLADDMEYWLEHLKVECEK